MTVGVSDWLGTSQNLLLILGVGDGDSVADYFYHIIALFVKL